MSTLRQRMNEAMVLRGFAERTKETYLACVSGLAKYYGRSPGTLDAAAIQAYLLHLINERKFAYASVNQAVCAIRIPVQFTCAEFEAMQVVGPPVLAEVGELLSGCGHRTLHMLATTAHNASLHRIARAYHLRVIASFEECWALRAGSAEAA